MFKNKFSPEDQENKNNQANNNEADELIDELTDTNDTDVDPNADTSTKPKTETSIFKAQAAENYDKYLRTVAELENYKKRAIKERAELIKYSGENLARDILNVIDDLERALNNTESGIDENFVTGVKMIYNNFISVLKQYQITTEQTVGEKFDPQKHEAMSMVPTDEYEPGVVMEEIRKLYLFKDKVLRVGQVVVAMEKSVSDKD
ncbi:MAG: nucleotide exchange factor GrpE [Deltaproteobacteria bacterium]|jgi:molecular chaperone GrpE|nr:nucleotide exchange factor GrpE [Deltaproteobacteria bacterium]